MLKNVTRIKVPWNWVLSLVNDVELWSIFTVMIVGSFHMDSAFALLRARPTIARTNGAYAVAPFIAAFLTIFNKSRNPTVFSIVLYGSRGMVAVT